MRAGQCEIACVERHHWQGETLCHPREGFTLAGIAAERAGDDQRMARGGDPVGKLLHVRGRRERRPRLCARRASPSRRRIDSFAQHLARQAEIDRPGRRGGGDLHRPRHHVGDLVRPAHLVVPFDELAQHAGLVEHLLRPVDVNVAGAGGPILGDRRAAGGDQHRDAIAAGVEQRAERVGQAHVDMRHHRLRPAGHRGVAMRHADGGVLVRDDQRLRYRAVGPRGAGECLDDGGEIGAGVDEQVVDALCGERIEVILGGDAGMRGHGGPVTSVWPMLAR